MFFLPGMEARARRHWRIELGGLGEDGGRRYTRGGVTTVARREDGDGLGMGIDTRGLSPLEE